MRWLQGGRVTREFRDGFHGSEIYMKRKTGSPLKCNTGTNPNLLRQIFSCPGVRGKLIEVRTCRGHLYGSFPNPSFKYSRVDSDQKNAHVPFWQGDGFDP